MLNTNHALGETVDCNTDASNVSKKKRRKKDVDYKANDEMVNNTSCSSVTTKFNVNRLRDVLQKSHTVSSDTCHKHGKNLSTDLSSKLLRSNGSNMDKKISRSEQGHKPGQSASVHDSLKERMTNRLSAARFRYINEHLYQSTGSEAAEMFASDRDAFFVYHSGYQSQVSKWPLNPVDKMIEFILQNNPGAVVADFGCGDAKISRSVPNTVHSFDLVALNDAVVACDMAHVPLKRCSVDIAVFCLSLMGTNLVEYLVEANRVLKLGGILLIADVVSRFDKLGTFVRNLRRLGFSLENKVVNNKMFVWLQLTKTGSPPPVELWPSVELFPCVYKKR